MITNVLPRFYETVYFENLLLIITRLLIHAVTVTVVGLIFPYVTLVRSSSDAERLQSFVSAPIRLSLLPEASTNGQSNLT